ncbi:MAG: DinB family protein [Acidimicrobiales bacterium]
MPITPDDKNWTWVLERPCPECSFDASSFPCHEVASSLQENASTWPSLLESPLARIRPSDQQWSALEYACHVRDVFRLFDRRLVLMLEQDDPLFDNWDQDATAVADRYDEQDPAVVVSDLLDAGAVLANRFDSVPTGAWTRNGRRSDGAAFTIDAFSRYLLHDPVHHFHDVNAGFAKLERSRPG